MLAPMADPDEIELRVALAEGILSRSEADVLAAEARRTRRSPLALLVAQGRLSEHSVASLIAEALRDPDRRAEALAQTVTSAAPHAAESESAPETAFPIAGWERYTSVRFLGQGGMGRVFLAFDPRVRREVAIKFVRGDDPAHVRRLIAEGRAQARIDHERVCKVHEVGEVDGKVYIAMQYIAGQSLGSIAGELTLEQKVMLVRGAAEGLHAAHRAGVIHRDVKPSNILVARRDDDELVPYVVDFGLARAGQDGGSTLSGVILGTPRYMAPEQALGEPARLDRRADVYSLGATLYHLVTGVPPVPGTTAVEILHNLAVTEPRSPRAIDPAIPADLEAIMVKCLERDRAQRYDSARALADDLGRFLDGEPVVARVAWPWYRLRKALARRRWPIAAGAVVAAALIGTAAWALQTRRAAGEREQLARRFTESVERIEAMARYSALAPVHDIRGDRRAIGDQMAALDAEMRHAGEVAAGPGHYALGRGHLVLGDDARARDELEAAWRLGFREPRVAYALALALGHLYRHGLLAAARIESTELRSARLRDIERQYRDPALRYLAASQGAEVPSTQYTAALIAFYETRFDNALEHLDAIGGGLPWFYEAPQLRGDILLATALARRDEGDRDAARRALEAGRQAYAAAGAIGESVPVIYESLGELEHTAQLMELYSGGDVAPPFQRSTAATARALAILPDDYDALVLEARAHRGFAEYRTNHGSPADDLLVKAIEDADRAVAIAPARPEARLELVQLYRQWGEALGSQSQDPSALLAKAVEASDHIATPDRDADYYSGVGLIFQVWADYEDDAGKDAQAHRTRAIDADVRALQLSDKLNGVRINLGINYFERASQPGAQDADGDLQRAIRVLDDARAIDPKHVLPYLYGGLAYDQLAARVHAQGGPADAPLSHALAAYRTGLAINPKLPQLYNGLGLALLTQATMAWDRGADPEPALAQAQAAFEQAIAVAPDQGFGFGNLGAARIRRAELQRAQGQDPRAELRAAAVALRIALDRIPDQPQFWAKLGHADAILAARDLATGIDPQPSLDRAAAVLDRALRKNPRSAEALCARGEARATRAERNARRGHGKAGEFTAAAEAFEQAIALAPIDLTYQVALARFCELWARFPRYERDPGAALRRGHALVDRVLAARPGWPDALIIRALLLLRQAEDANGDARRAYATEAANSFDVALTANPALARVWGPRAVRARQLAAAP
jgi:serine/threonine-protein kinase